MSRFIKFFTPPRLSFKNLFSFLLVGSITLLYVSCNKDEIKTQVVKDHDPKYDAYYKIVSFIETMEGKPQSQPFILPRTEYVPADIVEYIEGALNLEYTDPRLTWAGYESTTDTFEIALTSGHAGRVALEALYDEVIDSASAFFYRISESDKFPYLYDVVNLHATSSLLTITVEGIVGKVHRDPAPFGEDDYWSVFFGEGHCAPMSGETDNASDRLNMALNDYYTPYQCIFWTETHNVSTADLEDYGWAQLNGTDPNPGDFILDYRTFYSTCEDESIDCEEFVENGVYCLNPDEMNYYFQSIISIYNDYIDDTETQLRMSLFGLTEVHGTYNTYYWGGVNKFGTRYDCVEGNDFPFALPFCC